VLDHTISTSETGSRIAAVADCVKQVVIDDEQSRRILGNVTRVGDHHGNRLANIMNFVSRQYRLRACHRYCWIWQQHRHRLACPGGQPSNRSATHQYDDFLSPNGVAGKPRTVPDQISE
jgi:hypothetical protein